jgi:hypothetical protein
MIGTSAFAATPPLRVAVPLRPVAGSTPVETGLTADHVAPQVPSRRDVRGNKGSPFENVTDTVPVLRACAQSFATEMRIGVGHAAETLNAAP